MCACLYLWFYEVSQPNLILPQVGQKEPPIAIRLYNDNSIDNDKLNPAMLKIQHFWVKAVTKMRLGL